MRKFAFMRGLPQFVAAATVLALIADLAKADPPIPTPRSEAEPVVTRVRVNKAARRLELMAGQEVFRIYRIALGGNPSGHKQQQGDERTPEGSYVLDWRNPNSLYTRSIHISYPNKTDRDVARKRGVDPGGDIMIHGQPNAWPLPFVGMPGDWTLGCIAVSNDAMQEIWAKVKDGTPIDILP